jgi:arylsulfatase
MTISVNGQQVAQGEIKRSAMMVAGLGETFDTGRDTGEEVTHYRHGSAFTGAIQKVTVTTK